MTRTIFLAVVTAFVLMIVPFIAWGQERWNSDEAPNSYRSSCLEEFRNNPYPFGAGCCGWGDCCPVRWRIGPEGTIELNIDGWAVPIDPSKTPTQPSPDGRAYACWFYTDGKPRIICNIPPGGTS